MAEKGDIVTVERARRPGAAAIAALLLAVIFLSTCSKDVGPEKAIGRMIRAYGGGKGIARLTSYSGKGFVKQLPLIHVAASYPFDVYQKGRLYKTVMYNVKDGIVFDKQVLLVNETDRIQWTRSSGFSSLPEWEVELIRYRFPLLLEWLPASGISGRHVPSEFRDGKYRLRFEDGDDLLTLVLDDSSWLLAEMHLESASDSTFMFREIYEDYRRVDGIWFPNRFSAAYRGREYYEYLIPVIEIGVDFPDGFFVLSESDTILPPPRPPAAQ